jgi:hypothetical protein
VLRVAPLLFGSLLMSGACVVDHHNDPDPAPAVQPHSCVADVTLASSASPGEAAPPNGGVGLNDGSTGNARPTQVGPFVLDRNGVTLCLHLDATQNQVAAHFAAESDMQPGSSSLVATVLEDASYSVLQDSWDVTFDDVDPHTFANLEWNAPLHAVTDAMLWIHARDQATPAAPPTMISVALFEPLE